MWLWGRYFTSPCLGFFISKNADVNTTCFVKVPCLHGSVCHRVSTIKVWWLLIKGVLHVRHCLNILHVLTYLISPQTYDANLWNKYSYYYYFLSPMRKLKQRMGKSYIADHPDDKWIIDNWDWGSLILQPSPVDRADRSPNPPIWYCRQGCPANFFLHHSEDWILIHC